MKKRILIILFLLLFPLTVDAANGTLRDEKNELAAMQSKAESNRRLTTQKQNEIDSKRNAITKANNTINENEKKVENSKVKVAESEEQIKIKTEELKNVINVLQYSNINSGEIYVDYIFDSSSISELMERQAVITQIIDYTQAELDGLHKLIKDNQELQVQLADDNVVLANSITVYEKQVDELEAYIEKLASIGMDYQEQIKAKQNLIKQYEQAGCRDSDTIEACFNNKYMLSATSFNRPLKYGKVTQAYGNNGHAGMDIGGNKPGTNIYAPANGVVAATSYKNSCGGNIIYIHHIVNGQKYTSEYGHLTSIYVKVGQTVTPSTVIGTVGGDSSTFYYDKCTTGPHLHYSISYNHYLKDYTSWNTFKANTKPTGNESITHIRNVRGYIFNTRY